LRSSALGDNGEWRVCDREVQGGPCERGRD